MIAGEGSNQLDTIQMDFVARRFDTFSETFTIEYYDDDGALQEVDLTGAEAQMQLKKRKTDATPFFNMDIAISGNEVTVSKNYTQMDLPKGKYWHDLEIKDADGNHITWVQGRFVVVEHITHFVDTYVASFTNAIKAALEIIEVPKTTIVSYLKSMLSFENQTVFWLKSILKVTPTFITLLFIKKYYSGVFKSILSISTIPKTVILTAFRVAVLYTTNVLTYGEANFGVTVNFYEVD